MESEHRTANLRALALAVTVLSALTATLLVAQVSLTPPAAFPGYGIDETVTLAAHGSGR